MANAIEVTTLLSGPKCFIYHVYLKGGSGEVGDGELESYELIPAQIAPSGEVMPYIIEDITWGFSGFFLKLHFEVLPAEDTLIWVLPEDNAGYVDFKKYGGLRDRSNPLDASGKILVSTVGFTKANAEGSMVIKVRV